MRYGCHGPGCVLEALVLMDQEPDRIAERMRTTTEVVKLYESVFWDIRSRLSDHDFIVNRCVGLQNVGANRHRCPRPASLYYPFGWVDLVILPPN